MKHSATVLIWPFLVAPWLAWVAFHPIADARLTWVLIAHPRQGRAAVMEALHNAYDVPPFSYMFDAVRQLHRGRFVNAARAERVGARTPNHRVITEELNHDYNQVAACCSRSRRGTGDWSSTAGGRDCRER